MRNYKIEFRRSGHIHGPAYSQTIAGAVKIARKKGWCKLDSPESNWDRRPKSALILERAGDGWELVATVTEHGIQAEEHLDRRSYKLAEEKMDAARACMERTYATMLAIKVIVDKEFAKATQ